MKSVMIMCLCCLCAVMAFGQKGETTVTIKITSIKPDSIWVTGYGKLFYAKPGKDNQYVLHFKHDAPLKIQLGFEKPEKRNTNLLLEKGDQLNVVTDFDKHTVFSGKGAENARVWDECIKAYAAAYHEKELEVGNKMLSPTAAFNMYYGLGQIPLDVLVANKQKVSPVFYQDQLISFTYQKLNLPIMIPKYMAMSGKKLSESIPDHYWDIQKQVKLDEKLMENGVYSSFIKSTYPIFLNYKAKSEMGLLDSSLSEAADAKLTLSQVEKNYTGKMRSSTMRSIISSSLVRAKDPSVIKPLMDSYIAKYGSAEDAKAFNETYEKYSKLSAGNVPPAFVLKDQNGKDVTLKDFAGKVVYMDFWASWCAPCRGEMKNGAPKLHAKFKDNKDVVFLYISLDSKIDAWKKAIADDKIEGLHFLSQATSGVDSPVAKAFSITGIPRYVIIGKDGRIFDNDAPRPSQDITPKRINEALSAR